MCDGVGLSCQDNVHRLVDYNICSIDYVRSFVLPDKVLLVCTDPGAIPQCAVPVDSAGRRHEIHAMCRYAETIDVGCF